MDYALVLLTLPASIPADGVVRDLLARRLIAGANVLPDVATTYIDGGPPVATRETLYICRTLPARVAIMRDAVADLTGERDFEISVLSATAGNPPYAAWITRALDTAHGVDVKTG
jgi:uncharacterized protein involved in tolerance to divalent cations